MRWRLNKYTHEIVTAQSEVAARLRISRTGQIALDPGDGSRIVHSGGGSAFGYHVTYNMAGRDIFPAEALDCELHYFTGRSFEGCTVRAVENAC